MNQTRSFLFFAWIAVAFLLWMQWTAPKPPSPAATATAVPQAAAPNASPAAPGGVTLAAPSAAPAQSGSGPQQPEAASAAAGATAAALIRVQTDVLDVQIDLVGGNLVAADLRRYPQAAGAADVPVRLLAQDPASFFVAQSGLITVAGAKAPDHFSRFAVVDGATVFTLAEGSDELLVPLLWTDASSGLSVRKTYRFRRGSYLVDERSEISNSGTSPWRGHAYQRLLRYPPATPSMTSGFTNPEAYSFVGAAWYSPEEKFEKRTFAEFLEDGNLNRDVTGGWMAMPQHHFLTAWIPNEKETQRYLLTQEATPQGPGFAIQGMTAALEVAPGSTLSRESRLWIGPKLQNQLEDIAPGLKLTLDYGVFTFIAQPLFWVLNWLHGLLGNWGWAIIAIVVLLKLALYPLSAAQYKSMAKMRAVQPRIEALKERYGEDRQKFQVALMELYKKEKINPVGGCLPILVTIPIFIALYWVLLESVELRQAPWVGWIHNLTAPDPWFILPALNLLVMWLTQKLTPMPGMDPIQKKMLTFMPLVFGVLMAFFPSGLVLYWCSNGLLGLLQQWWMTRQHGGGAAVVAK